MNKEERQNILDQHKSLYDGYVTRENKMNSESPIYIQDLANDKNGITVNNKGVVKTYTNVGINEGLLDMVADGPRDLKNGTVDFDSVSDMESINKKMLHKYYPTSNENDEGYVSAGMKNIDDNDNLDVVIDIDDTDDRYEYDIDEMGDYHTDVMYEMYQESEPTEEDYYQEEEDLTYSERLEDVLQNLDEDVLPDVVYQLYESMEMFRRFNKYN